MEKINLKVVIPVREGSKRFPGKNLARLNGVELFLHSVNYAIEEKIPKRDIWINTDDAKIIAICKKLRINVFERSKELGGDYTTTGEVLKEQALSFIKDKIDFDGFILLQATNPLRPLGLLRDCVNHFFNSGRDSLATFSDCDKKFGEIIDHYFIPTNYEFGQRSQDISKSFYENGLVYITSKKLLCDGKVMDNNLMPFIINHVYSQVDIDYKEDFEYAEFLIQKNIKEK